MIDAVADGGGAPTGSARLWAGEHVVMVDRPRSRYPYAADGRIAGPGGGGLAGPDGSRSASPLPPPRRSVWPQACSSCPSTTRSSLAKQAASLDSLSGGGASPWARAWAGLRRSLPPRRALCTDAADSTAEYVQAMRALWREDVASFTRRVRLIPQSPGQSQARRATGLIPVAEGGNSDAALRRAAAWGDGRYGFNLADVAAVSERLGMLGRLCADAGRPIGELDVAVALAAPDPGDVAALTELGVGELVLVEAPPAEPVAAAEWVAALAERWG